MSALEDGAIADDMLVDDGPDCCAECLDEFHYDDCGGYNPPCSCTRCCGLLCRSCCERRQHEAELRDDNDHEDRG